MDQRRYVGMDVHQATISVAVMDSTGNVVMESIIETKASTILELIRAMRGTLWVTFEEGTSAAWLYDLLTHMAKEFMRLGCRVHFAAPNYGAPLTAARRSGQLVIATGGSGGNMTQSHGTKNQNLGPKKA